MYFQYILIILSGILKIVQSHLDLPEIIYEICPYSDICNRTAAKSLNVKGMEPCCSSCRCDEKCGLRLDCCFADMDKYHLEENGVISCITPYTTEQSKPYFHSAYWMIKSCKYESLQTDKNIPCELYDEKGKYLIEPVSSKETDNIYVNEKCALCNNVYNFTKWNYLVLKPHKQVGPSVWEMKNGQENPSHWSVYIPPKEDNWSMKRCFSKFQDTCTTNSTLKNLCHTLKMPYVNNFGYRSRNPFCYICKHGNVLTKECKKESERTAIAPFTVLIDTSIIAPSKFHKNVMINKRLELDCRGDISVRLDLKSCLPLYCPNGMLMTPTGCRYFIRQWHIPSFSIQFKLWRAGGNELPVAALNSLSPKERKNPALRIKIPCYQVKADVMDVYYEIDKNKQKTIKSFIVRLWKLTKGGINPSFMVPLLHKCLNYNWHINILGKTYKFRPTLDKYSTYVQDGQQFRMNKLTYKREGAARPKLYTNIAARTVPNSMKFSRKIIVLKTFFCDQVNLPMNAVEVLFGELRILSKNITLGDNEFAVNLFPTKNDDGIDIIDINKTTFSVCIEDYDSSYIQWRPASALSSRIILLEQRIKLFMLLQLHMYINFCCK